VTPPPPGSAYRGPMGLGGTRVIERRSNVEASAERVWARVITPEGINDELRPWMTMSMPRGAGTLTVDTIPVGAPVGRSWLRLFGVAPFDYDDLMIAELEPGRRFREESTMLSMSLWRHERTVTPDGPDGATVHDRVTFRLRLPLRLATPVVASGISALFGHRHRRLAHHFSRG
jgi:ligand-binding SRPBCC domain-containing protein